MEWLSKIIEIIKIPIKYFIIIFLCALVLTFLPDNILSQLKLLDLRSTYQIYISLTLIISGIILFVELIHFLIKKYNFGKQNKKLINSILSNLKKLDPQEKSVLREFFIQHQNTLLLPYNEAIIAGLINKRILQIIGNTGEQSLAGVLIPIKINELIKEKILLTDIDMPTTDPLSEEDIEFLKNNRPDFLPEIDHHMNLFHRGWWR